MRSNTKLTTEQKRLLKLRMVNCKGVTLVNNGKTTIAYIRKGSTVEFALSVASPDEKKFRRKVGEYYALGRIYGGASVKMAVCDFEHMMCEIYDIFVEL